MLLLQPGINAAARDKLVVTTRFLCDAGFDHANFVGVDDGAHAVGDHQRGAASAKFLQGVLDGALGFRIQRGGRFVKKDNGRIFEKGACDGDALALTAGKLHAVLAAWAIIAALKTRNKFMRVRRLRGGDNFGIAGAGTAHADIVAYRSLEQECFLADVGQLSPQRSARNLRNILPVDCYRARLRLVKAQDHVHCGRLAAA